MINLLKFLAFRSWIAFIVAVGILSGCAAPRPAPVRDTTPPEPVAAPASAQVKQEGVHVVRPGDTLLGIARQYGVSVKDLVAWNSLADANQIHVGQSLRVAPANGAGSMVQPIGTAPSVEIQPIKPPGEPPAHTPPGLKQDPRGGKQPYSAEAWGALSPGKATAPEPVAAEPEKGSGNTVWLWPAAGQVVGTFDEGTNKGVDISGKTGDPVIASAAGKVVYAGSGLRGYGKLVIIKHDANYLTAYAHNQQLLVKEGDAVSKGQKIAEMGSTDADRPKVHFEIRKQGRPVDPLKYLPAR